MDSTDKIKCRILLVDDDPSFGKILQKIAKQQNISIISCAPLENPQILTQHKWDAAIVDFDLGNTTGIQFASILEKILGNVPTIIVSQTERGETVGNRWPKSIWGFIPKSAGHLTILDMAVDAWQRSLKGKRKAG